MNLSEILTEDCIQLNLEATKKEEAVREMARLAAQSGRISDVETLVDALEAREKLQTTGIGHALAIPHATTEVVRGMVLAMGISPGGVDYNAIDQQPVRLIFLLAGEPRMQTSFLSVLSKISRFFRKDSFRDEIIQAASPKEILAIIQAREEH